MDRFQDLIPIRHPQDKRRYICAWFLFGGLLVAYAIYLAVKVAQSYDNPGAKIGVSTKQPPWPVFAVCYDTPLEEPVVTASWIGQGVNSFDFKFEYQRVNISTFDSIYSNEFNCVQFNHDKTINKTSGKLEIFSKASYQLNAARSVGRLFILPQDQGPFTSSTEAELYDELILPTGSLVEARWTVLQHVRVSGEKDTRYQLVQQVEDLTTSSKKDIVQELSAFSAIPTSCVGKAFGFACTFGGFTGLCTGIGQTNYSDEVCAYHCTNGSQYGDYFQISWRCDGYNDCYDAADEQGCVAFQCLSDGAPYTQSQQCNGVGDCLDNSDESNCTTLPIILAVQVSPYTQFVTITQDVVTFGWESFFASLASGWSIVTLVVAFLFPEEAENFVKWRLRREAGEPKTEEKQVEMQEMKEERKGDKYEKANTEEEIEKSPTKEDEHEKEFEKSPTKEDEHEEQPLKERHPSRTEPTSPDSSAKAE